MARICDDEERGVARTHESCACQLQHAPCARLEIDVDEATQVAARADFVTSVEDPAHEDEMATRVLRARCQKINARFARLAEDLRRFEHRTTRAEDSVARAQQNLLQRVLLVGL